MSPQVTQTWADTDGEHVIINSLQGYVKLKNIKRDPRVAVVISAPDNPMRYFALRRRASMTLPVLQLSIDSCTNALVDYSKAKIADRKEHSYQ